MATRKQRLEEYDYSQATGVGQNVPLIPPYRPGVRLAPNEEQLRELDHQRQLEESGRVGHVGRALSATGRDFANCRSLSPTPSS